MKMLLLANQACFPLYALSRKITTHYQPLLERLDLTYPQYLVMLLLWEEPQLSVKELGQRLMLDSGTLTPLLKRLEEKGFVLRTRNDRDERVVDITLTGTGLKLKRKAASIPEELACSLGLTGKELVRMREMVQGMLAKIEKTERETSG